MPQAKPFHVPHIIITFGIEFYITNFMHSSFICNFLHRVIPVGHYFALGILACINSMGFTLTDDVEQTEQNQPCLREYQTILIGLKVQLTHIMTMLHDKCSSYYLLYCSVNYLFFS